jgi:hypothetical protein
VSELSSIEKPVLYVEGKNDVTTLTHAWEKLNPSINLPFLIKSCNPIDNSDDEISSAGEGTLKMLISTIPADNPKIAIAMFDRDTAGVNAYKKLPKLFKEDLSIDAKISINGTAAAFIIPIPPGKEGYAEVQNLLPEFYFSDSVFDMKTSQGHGLKLRQPTISSTLDINARPTLEKKTSESPYHKQIVNGKTVFAENIIPLLSSDEFSNFKYIFDKVESLIIMLNH